MFFDCFSDKSYPDPAPFRVILAELLVSGFVEAYLVRFQDDGELVLFENRLVESVESLISRLKIEESLNSCFIRKFVHDEMPFMLSWLSERRGSGGFNTDPTNHLRLVSVRSVGEYIFRNAPEYKEEFSLLTSKSLIQYPLFDGVNYHWPRRDWNTISHDDHA